MNHGSTSDRRTLLEKRGVVGLFCYRYLPTISGIAPDVERIEARIKRQLSGALAGWLNDDN